MPRDLPADYYSPIENYYLSVQLAKPAWSTVEWCGIPVPDTDGRWRLIVVEGEAR